MIKKKKLILISLLFLLLNTNVSAQSTHITFERITADKGLSFNNVITTIKDKHGLIWGGTTYGLNRYDGYNFKYFFPKEDDSSSIISQYINDLLEDKNGFIWIATPDGLCRYNWETETFTNYTDKNSNLSNNNILTLYMDKNGDIWIGTFNGLNKYNALNDSFTNYLILSDYENIDASNSVIDIEEDSEGNLWLATWNGLTKFSRDGKVLKTFFTNAPETKDFDYRIISRLKYDKSGNLWIGMRANGFKKFNTKTDTFKSYTYEERNRNSISNNNVNCIEIDPYGRLWIGTIDGLNIFDPINEKFTRIYNNNAISYTIGSNQINNIFIESSGMHWISTTYGISKYYAPKNDLKYYQYTNDNDIYGLTNESVIDLFIDNEDNLWIGTLNGLNKLDNKTQKVSKFFHDPNNPNSPSENFIRSIYKDSQGIIWVGTNYKGLNSYNTKTKQWSLYKFDLNDNTSISNNGILSITEDSKGFLWFGTWWGANKFDKKTQKFQRFVYNKGDSNSIQNSAVWDIIEDSEQNLWFATNGGGVSKLDVTKNKFTHFNKESNQNYISANRVFQIYESSDGLMWFSTSNGLNQYNKLTGKTTVYNKNNGLPDNLIQGIVEDNENNIWITTNKGLVKYKRDKNIFITYTERDGLRDNAFIQNVISKSKDGKLYFGTQGILCIEPQKFIESEQLSNIVFTDLKISNQSVNISPEGILRNSLFGSSHIYIPPGNEMLTFEFALLDYFDNNISYRYKLKGFDSHWNYIGKRNSVTFTNLKPQEYTLTILASTNNTTREAETSIKITIIPYFYQTIIFKIFLLAALIGFIIFLIKFRTRTIEKQKKELEQKVIIRTLDLAKKTEDLNNTVEELNQEIATKDKFFSIIAHDLRSPFMGLLGFAKHLVDDLDNLLKEDIKLISSSILKSAGLTFSLLQNLLQWARIQTGKIDYNPEEIDLLEVIYNMKELYTGNAKNKDITISIEKGDIKPVIADLNMIETVVRNLISNAIKFTQRGGKIILKLEIKNEMMKVSVIDNGVGMEQSVIDKLFSVGESVSTYGTDNEQGSGLGLILCKEFIEYNKGTIKVESEIDNGTIISIYLPVKN